MAGFNSIYEFDVKKMFWYFWIIGVCKQAMKAIAITGNKKIQCNTQ